MRIWIPNSARLYRTSPALDTAAAAPIWVRRSGDLARHVEVIFDEWSAQNWRTSWIVAAGFSNGTR